MALKNLVAKKAEVAEAAIESIVSDYIRYYVDSQEIGFTPKGAELSAEKRTLVYLVALLGWRYVTDKPPIVKTNPANLEKALGIPGGTLRPLLKSLKESHLISSSNDGYSVREGNLEAIAATVKGEKKVQERKRKQKSLSVTTHKSKAKPTRSNGKSIAARIEAWIKDGFFKTPRTLSAAHKRLHELGVIAPLTAVSTPMLRAVQQDRLARRKASENGKEIWVYYAPEV